MYKFSCSADPNTAYIGKTSRHLITRIFEHKAQKLSSIHDHLLCCDHHEHLSDDFAMVCSGVSDFDIKIKEALTIQTLKPSLNVQKINNYQLKLFL